MEGRLEICLNNEWGTVCNQMWNDTNAQVVCRQLGLVLSRKYGCACKDLLFFFNLKYNHHL